MYHAYYTHRKYLIDSLNSFPTDKDIEILEFGVGEGSSFILNEFVLKNKKANVTAFETDKKWLEKIENKYKSNNYKFKYVKNWENLLIEENFKKEYDLVFIDQSPWEARIQTLDFFINKSKIIILHDYDYYNKGLSEDIFDVGKNSFFGKYLSEEVSAEGFKEELPPTLVFKKTKKKKQTFR